MPQIQQNGVGSVTVQDFTVVDFGKLYRSCGNCDEMGERKVTMSGITAINGKVLTGINSNYGDSKFSWSFPCPGDSC